MLQCQMARWFDVQLGGGHLVLDLAREKVKELLLGVVRACQQSQRKSEHVMQESNVVAPVVVAAKMNTKSGQVSSLIRVPLRSWDSNAS